MSRRRCDLTRMSKAELLLHEAVQEIEKMGADPLLTTAITCLSDAKEQVAHFIELEFGCDCKNQKPAKAD